MLSARVQLSCVHRSTVHRLYELQAHTHHPYCPLSYGGLSHDRATAPTTG